VQKAGGSTNSTDRIVKACTVWELGPDAKLLIRPYRQLVAGRVGKVKSSPAGKAED
jgi:hypothetical protein